MPGTRIFPSSKDLQNFLLEEAAASSLILVPHRRLARQVWHRQRLRNLERGRGAWEPLPLKTLPDWWTELYQHLWLPLAPAPRLVRLALWQQAMDRTPAPEGVQGDLTWAQALDEAHELLLRHELPISEPHPDDPPLVSWRREVSLTYRELLREEGWLAPGELPAKLFSALTQGRLPLPPRLFVVGLETPAPVEARWLEAVSAHIPVTWLTIKGNPQNLTQALVFPDQEQELAWAAAKLLQFKAEENLPFHRLAVTSPEMDLLAPGFRRLLRELLGPGAQEEGFVYNFSKGPSLEETPLWHAALLPLTFLAQGERREDLLALFLSPYYQALKPYHSQLATWDRLFRETSTAQGWEAFQAVVREKDPPVLELSALLEKFENLWAQAPVTGGSGRTWVTWLMRALTTLGFPGELSPDEKRQWEKGTEVLAEFAAAPTGGTLSAAQALSWLQVGAQEKFLPDRGTEEAGIQVLGWLEIRGLDFDRVVCLKMTSATFPGAARPLPLLGPAERERVLGGTQESQDRFAREVFENLLGVAPQIILTRPAQEHQEPQVGTPFYLGAWKETSLAYLSQPHPAWLRAPAVKAALTQPEPAGQPGPLAGCLKIACPQELKVTQLATGLSCLMRFVLEEIWGLQALPDIDSGLDPRERGQKLHEVLARFVKEVQFCLPPEEEALSLLKEVARQVLGPEGASPDWEAEWRRWFGDELTPGLLPAWLRREQERHAQGWRWLAVEAAFQGLTRPGWPFTIRGRLDRVDGHPEEGLMVWDYKTGELPKAVEVFDKKVEFQLPAYLWAVREGRVKPDWARATALAAGFIGLKSPRDNHLQHQDFAGKKETWPEVLTAWEEEVRRLGERLLAGDLAPNPRPAPVKSREGACTFCPFSLLCGYEGEPEDVEESK